VLNLVKVSTDILRTIVSYFSGKEEDFNAWMDVFMTYLKTRATREKENCCKLNSDKSTCECKNGVVETQVRRI
jgi:hypothetical protein